jgi:hypothetical protein
VGTGTKEDESNTGRIWAAGFHRVTVRSHLVHILKFTERLFLELSSFLEGGGSLCQPRILYQWIQGA